MTTHPLQNEDLQGVLALINAGNLVPAAQALVAMEQRAPDDARLPLLGLRMAYKAGNSLGAVRMAQHATQLAPEWPVAHIELALALAKTKQIKEAMESARRAVQLAPHDLWVLLHAISVAEGDAESEDVFAWIKTALLLAPSDASVCARLQQVYGNELLKRKRYAEARAPFEAALASHPNAEAEDWAQRGLLMVAMRAEDYEAAIPLLETLRARHPDDETLAYVWEVAHGRTPASVPVSEVRALYADYAQSYDAHMEQAIKPVAPQTAANRIRELYPELRLHLLDLACGTGWLGKLLGKLPQGGKLTGIDLSPEMLQRAAQLGVYDRLQCAELREALRTMPDASFDVVCCLEALVYIGDLAPVLPQVARVLHPGGHFIFSCERAAEDEADMVLRSSRRFAHKESAVLRLARESFAEVRVTDLPQMRMEGGAPLAGFLVVAQR